MTTLVRLMTEADIPFGMSLKAQAGWNQLEADWLRFLQLEPEGCFLAEREGEPVGTVTTCRFGPVGWIAMMLVRTEVRGQGIGRRLMNQALAYLEGLGVESVRLDATPLGQPLYESLGFRTDAKLLRYAGRPSSAEGRSPAQVYRPAPTSDAAWQRLIDRLATIDVEATGTPRRRFLESLVLEHHRELHVIQPDDALEGFVLARPGSRAIQIGPVIGSAASGPELLADALARHAGQSVFVDTPAEQQDARRVLEAAGLAVSRELTRMTRGPAVGERLDRIWASSGPEMG